MAVRDWFAPRGGRPASVLRLLMNEAKLAAAEFSVAWAARACPDVVAGGAMRAAPALKPAATAIPQTWRTLTVVVSAAPDSPLRPNCAEQRPAVGVDY